MDTAQPAAPTAARPSPSSISRRLDVMVWSLQGGTALAFLGTGLLKIVGIDYFVVMFEQIGHGQWLRYLVGGAETAAAVALMVPRPRLIVAAAAGLLLLMAGAVLARLMVIDGSPVRALTHAAAVALILWVRSRAID